MYMCYTVLDHSFLPVLCNRQKWQHCLEPRDTAICYLPCEDYLTGLSSLSHCVSLLQSFSHIACRSTGCVYMLQFLVKCRIFEFIYINRELVVI